MCGHHTILILILGQSVGSVSTYCWVCFCFCLKKIFLFTLFQNNKCTISHSYSLKDSYKASRVHTHTHTHTHTHMHACTNKQMQERKKKIKPKKQIHLSPLTHTQKQRRLNDPTIQLFTTTTNKQNGIQSVTINQFE